ncbi:MAG: hypothetical protein JXA53_11305 [Bacteroidales bacterium]|nr:hypothetical protein [Bacteroidales bacterium]
MNPLKEYKENHPELQWVDISEKTGIPLQTLMSIIKKDKTNIGGVTIATAITLKEKLGVDLLTYI